MIARGVHASPRMLVLVVLLVALLAPTRALAQGPPPRWDDVVSEAELIARVRVVEPGRFGAMVQVEESFYGEAPTGPFLVIGFSDGAAPPEIIDEQSMRRDEVLWLFLSRWDGPRPGIDMPIWELDGWEPEPGQTWTTASPIAGDVPMRGAQARVRLALGGYHHLAPPMPVEDWEALLRAMIAHYKDGRTDAAGITRAATCLDRGPSPPGLVVDEPPDIRCLAELRLRGFDRADPRLRQWQDGAPLALGAAAGLAARSGDPAFDDLIRAAAVHPNPDVGFLLLNMAAPDGDARLAQVIAPLLPASRGDRSVGQIPLKTLRDEATRGRLLELLAAIAHADARDILVAELRFLNPDLLFIAIEALERIEPGSWVEPSLPILQAAELRRTTLLLEALKAFAPGEAREPLHRFIGRQDVDPGLVRMAIDALGELGDDSTARRLEERLAARLRFTGAWPDDRVDMAGAELDALQRLDPAAAVEPAWAIARQYLGQPGAWVEPDFRDPAEQELSALEGALLEALPPDSTAQVRVVTERENAFVDRGQRVVIVDAQASAGVTPTLRATLARIAGTTPERVRLCGPDPRGRVRCLRDRGSFWEPHSRLLLPMMRALGARAGLTRAPLQPPDPMAGRWFAHAVTRGWMEQAEVRRAYDELWVDWFMGPIHPDEAPPMVPPGTPELDPGLPAR